MKRILSIIYLSLSASVILAQDSLVTQLFSENARPINIVNNSLKGDGAVWLQEQLEATQFILVGEDHGLAEVPEFVDALYNDCYSQGFTNFATEIGPRTLPSLLSKSAQPNLDGLANLNASFPFSIPFYWWQQEAKMLQRIYSKNNYAKNSIWALDQEFIVSLRQHLVEMAEKATTPEAKTLVLSYQAKADSLLEVAVERQNFGSNLMFSLTEEDFNKLNAAFNGQEDLLQLINDIKESQHIYFQMSTNAYYSNVDRIALMKRNFYDFYDAAKVSTPTPKAIFKFGATHMYRGASMLNVFDLGNLASEIANSNQLKSFHILVVGKQGTVNRYFLMNSEDLKAANYNGLKEFKEAGLAPLFDLDFEDDWQLIDLEGLQNAVWSRKVKVSKALEKTIYAFDAILYLPNVTAASNF